MATPNSNPSLPVNPYLATARFPHRSRPTTPTRTNAGPSTRPANHGSATQTITSAPDSPTNEALVLRLRGAHTPQPHTEESIDEVGEGGSSGTKRRRHIQWAEEVIDNEGLGRKKSKVCCIYHKPRAMGESSSEDDSSDSDSDASNDESDGARPVGGSKGKKKGHQHDHGEEDDCDHDHGHGHKHGSGTKRKPSPNAYEKMPKYDVKRLTQQPG